MRAPFASALVVALSACSPTAACPSGTSLEAGRCVEADVGATADGGADANVDAATVDAHAPCGGACNGTTPHCDTASDTCVACLTDDHCTDPDASVCGTQHTCEACGTSADCTHLTATPVCDTAAMSCVECLTNEDCAATEGCDAETHACVTFTPDSVDTCGACTRDAECHTGQLCVPMTFHAMAAGSHCAWRQDAAGSGAPNGNCAMVSPYVNGAAVTSVDGVSAMACTLASSTCDALADFRTGGAAASGQCTGATTGTSADPDCGAPTLDDGFCRIDSSSNHYCTVGCTTMADCPCTDGTCATHYPCNSGFCSLNP